jgi:hypothetical protein
VLRVLEVDPQSHVPERRAILVPWSNPADFSASRPGAAGG